MIEYADTYHRSAVATVARAVRAGAMPRKILRRLNEIRRGRHLPEIEVADPLDELRSRAAIAVARMKAAVAAR